MLTSNLLIILCYVSVAWLISAWLTRADVIDAFWGPGFVLVACVSLGARNQSSPASTFQWVLLTATTIWGMRLGLHLLVRWWGEQHEDRRYAAMRSAGGTRWWLQSLATVFFLQGGILWVVSLPLQFALAGSSPDRPGLFAGGGSLWLIGMVFESVGDWQLTNFRRTAHNVDKVLKSGLWRYTRHPNYFGDFMVWWGLFVMSISLGSPLWTFVGPLIMSVFLMKYSGVGMLERTITSRRPGYADYVKSTNAFFPWKPKSTNMDHTMSTDH